MFFFALGTWPMLVMVRMGSRGLSRFFHGKAVHMMRIAIFMMGALLVLRGLGMGIPYLSPELTAPLSPEACDPAF